MMMSGREANRSASDTMGSDRERSPDQRVLAIVGAGGHGREVLATLVARMARSGEGQGVLGFIDDDRDLRGKSVDGIPVIGSTTDLPPNVGGLVLGVGYPEVKARLVEALRSSGVPWVSLVHPDATVGQGVRIGEGALVQARAVLTADIVLHDFVTVNTGASVSHDSALHDYCTVSPGAQVAGGVAIEEGAFIGIGATIIQNIRIGARSVVGAGAVVIRDVPADTVVAGVPARPIGHRN